MAQKIYYRNLGDFFTMKKIILILLMLLFSAATTYAQPCNGNFDNDSDVDGMDAVMFKIDYGRMDCPSCTFSCY